jgi:hypothetical protein
LKQNRIISTVSSMSHEQQQHLLNKVELSLATNLFFSKPINKPILSAVVSAVCDKPKRTYHHHSQQSRCRIISTAKPLIGNRTLVKEQSNGLEEKS